MSAKNQTLTLFVTLIFTFTLMGCAQPSPSPIAKKDAVTVKLSWKHSAQFLGFYVAQAKGYYAEENLEVTILPLNDASEMDVVPGKIAAREIDFGVGGQSLILAHQDIPIVMIASLYQFSAAALFSRAELGILTPLDLKGHSVAIKSKAWELLIDGLLDSFGMSPNDITKVPAGFDMTPFYDGKVDVWAGWVTSEVILARQHGMDVVTLPLYEYGIRNSDNMIYASQELVASNPGLVERFLRATLRGWDWAVEHPAASVDIFIAQYPNEAQNRDFQQASFEASIPLIVPGGVRAGSLDCSTPQFRDTVLNEAFCNNTLIQKARKGIAP
jgi:NitT/TauT family transport system substrate-binding protein